MLFDGFVYFFQVIAHILAGGVVCAIDNASDWHAPKL